MHRSSILLAALAALLLTPAGARATPRLVDDLLARGVLPRDEGLSLLRRHGAVAARNTVIAPSLTAASHVAMATGASAARNDVVSNTFHLLASPFAPSLSTVSGFGAPIGGYDLDPGGRPRADVFVVSDHGFDPFHTAVNVNALLAGAGIPATQARAVTSGPAVNVYIDLDDRPRGHVGSVRSPTSPRCRRGSWPPCAGSSTPTPSTRPRAARRSST